MPEVGVAGGNREMSRRIRPMYRSMDQTMTFTWQTDGWTDGQTELRWLSGENMIWRQFHWLLTYGNLREFSIFLYYFFMRESSYCFHRVLAIAVLPVCTSAVTRVDQSKTVQARITKSSPSAAWKTLVSGTVISVKLFHKFEGGHPERGR